MTDALVIGAGPAGLMAAQELARAGRRVVVAEGKPSVARKLLMAGKSGLNLTKDEPFDRFLSAFGPEAEHLTPMLRAFGPEEVKNWAIALEQSLFTGSTGRVFPKAMKASPLLRAWLASLADLGVNIRTRWSWRGWDAEDCLFDTPGGPQNLTPKVMVLACGGASWARLGSSGAWAEHLPSAETSPFLPANMGFEIDWSDHMQRHFGSPVKGVALHAGETRSRGEFVISRTGIEGGGVYSVSRALRSGAPLVLDLMPDISVDGVHKRLSRPRGKASVTNHLRKTLGLDPVKVALLMEFAHPLPGDPAPLIKSLSIPLLGPRPMDQAISTAGGLRFDALDRNLMLRSRPGVFAAGEMLDWEAPTGGYLLTACLATGHWAGRAAARFDATQGI
ncbi:MULTISPECIES: TIGR03862 family flavoprotein [unclassified Roseovarius]|uniref:TIGR03862 family flavoprotein n=1 Tax=unclassified Roseovarius TaxID=2614913 RepID=UPI00273D5A0A|nr:MULTISPECIES: TIGR03862 family flavoprotein [unclassified Roseovarius]